MPGSTLRSENASASSSSKASGARGRFWSHQSAARSMCLCARFVTRTSTASAVTTSQPREHLFGRNRFSSIGLGDRKEQFGLLLRGQGEAALLVFGHNSHRRAFFQRHALNYDLTPDDFSSSDLHNGKNTPIQLLSWTDAERRP